MPTLGGKKYKRSTTLAVGLYSGVPLTSGPPVFVILLLLLAWCSAVRAAEEEIPFKVGCPVGLSTTTPERAAEIQEAISQETIKIKASASTSSVKPFSITIPVSAWIIRPANSTLQEGEALPTVNEVLNQIDNMVVAAGDEIDIPGSAETGVRSATPYIFKLCRNVQQTAPNDLWYACATRSTGNKPVDYASTRMKEALHIGGSETLNMYIKPVWDCEQGALNHPLDGCPAGYGRVRRNGITQGQFAGMATFPWDLNFNTARYDGIVVHSSSLPGRVWNGISSGHGGGTHESGHWLGLLHTFDEGGAPGIPWTDAGRCQADDSSGFFGDGCTDTPPMIKDPNNQNCEPFKPCDLSDNQSPGCPNSCAGAPGRDPNYNHMNYLQSQCHREFTKDQVTRMQASWAQWRQGDQNNLLGVRRPAAIDDFFTIAPGVEGFSLNVLVNDYTYLDNFDLKIDRIVDRSQLQGTVKVMDDERHISYTAPVSETEDTFTYSIFDCNGVSSPATVTITVQAGGACATSSSASVACRPGTVSCATTEQVVTLSPTLAGGSCDDTPMPEGAVNSTFGLSYTLYPPGPYPPGSYQVRATPVENSSPSCEVQLRVVPCPARCQHRTVATDPGLCQAGSVNVLDASTIGRTALSAPQTTTQFPAGPYQLGVTPSVAGTVHYPAGIDSAVTAPGCDVTVKDKEAPRVSASDRCIYPVSTPRRRKASYSKVEHCFDVAEFATLTDNCPTAAVGSLSFLSCSMKGLKMSKAAIKKHGAACTIREPAKLCVSLVPRAGKLKPRIIKVTVLGADTSGNTVKVEKKVVIYFRTPSKRRKGACEPV